VALVVMVIVVVVVVVAVVVVSLLRLLYGYRLTGNRKNYRLLVSFSNYRFTDLPTAEASCL